MVICTPPFFQYQLFLIEIKAPYTYSDFIFKILTFLAKNWDLMLSSIIKFDICGDILVTRIFEEFWHSTTRENVAVLGQLLNL